MGDDIRIEPDAACGFCGATGSYWFMPNHVCAKCLKAALKVKRKMTTLPVNCLSWVDMEPVLRHRHCGGWLAVSPEGAGLRIGTTGDTEDEARAAFIQARDRSAELFALESPPRQEER
jgi:hypothetical protein